MKKRYIVWWVISAWLFFGCCRFVYDLIFLPSPQNYSGIPVLAVFFVLSLLCLYIGYRRFQEYKEYQEDRKIRNEYYKSNTRKDDE